jgi:nitrogen fixation-related uncharacterized protein
MDIETVGQFFIDYKVYLIASLVIVVLILYVFLGKAKNVEKLDEDESQLDEIISDIEEQQEANLHK